MFLFLLAGVDNLILQASRPERWGMLYLAITGFLSGLFILLKGPKNELRENMILYFIHVDFMVI
jgi:potassium efflux system protein